MRKPLVVLLLLVTMMLALPGISVAQSDSQNDKFGTPKFATDLSVTTVPATSKTVPHWTSSFTYQVIRNFVPPLAIPRRTGNLPGKS